VTLVVALRCADGLVVASDSQSTAQTGSQPTKGDIHKLFILGSQFAWGGSGPIGSIQRVRAELEGCTAEIVRDFKHFEPGMKTLHKHIHKIQDEVERETLGDLQAKAAQRSAYLVAFFTEDGPHILEFETAGSRTLHDTDGFSAIGSGDIFAMHSFRSLRHHQLVTLSQPQAQALAWRTVDDAIATAAWGLGGPVSIAVVDSKVARMLEPQEVEAVRDTVGLWRQQEVEILGALGRLSGLPAETVVPEPPTEA